MGEKWEELEVCSREFLCAIPDVGLLGPLFRNVFIKFGDKVIGQRIFSAFLGSVLSYVPYILGYVKIRMFYCSVFGSLLCMVFIA